MLACVYSAVCAPSRGPLHWHHRALRRQARPQRAASLWASPLIATPLIAPPVSCDGAERWCPTPCCRRTTPCGRARTAQAQEGSSTDALSAASTSGGSHERRRTVTVAPSGSSSNSLAATSESAVITFLRSVMTAVTRAPTGRLDAALSGSTLLMKSLSSSVSTTVVVACRRAASSPAPTSEHRDGSACEL